MRFRTYRYFACDFETTVYANQTSTEVWASASVELNTDEVKIFHSIEDQFEYFLSLKSNLILYYHNLKFDGNFWINFLLTKLHYTLAVTKLGEEETAVAWKAERYMQNNTFKCSISDRGQWYTIIIKTHNHIIEIRDSLKLLPFSLKRIGESFQTRHQKLSMEYEGFRYAGCPISDEEQEYIANDVLVLKEALEIMFSEGHNRLTIGSCCLAEYKHLLTPEVFKLQFPNIYSFSLNEEQFGESNAGDYIRHSYKGGWCYLVKKKANKIYHNGNTADVNSLYPSMMSSESGNEYPIGLPTFWSGNRIPEEALEEHRYFFIRIRTRFYIKENMLPFIQIKGSHLYKGTEALESSDVLDRTTGQYNSVWIDSDGHIHDTRVTLTLTMTDYWLFLEHYNTVDFEILDGCYFSSVKGIFDTYIEKYKKIKLESKGAKRELAKLFLNNLYGKMASNTDSSFKLPFLDEDNVLHFKSVEEYDKEPGYIPVGSAITSYARNFTIRSAQLNYHGPDKPGFIYADTDSIHCDLPSDQIVGITVHPRNFCCWKLESQWDEAIFTRQKTYIEHVTGQDCEPIEKPYYNVKCAGMSDECKELFLESLEGRQDVGRVHGDTENGKQYTLEERRFLFDDELKPIRRELKDFRAGLGVPGKLVPKSIKGGVVLVSTSYVIH